MTINVNWFSSLTNFLKKHYKITVVCLFLLLSLIPAIPLRTHQIISSGDFLFHINRIQAFIDAFKQGHLFLWRNFLTFDHIGSSVNFFYPYVYIWLWSWLFLLIGNSINAFYLGLVIIMFVTLLVANASMLTYSKSKRISILFAVIYAFMPYHLWMMTGQFVLGEAMAYTFIPLFFLGVYKAFFTQEKSGWIILSVSLVLVLYAHMLTFALMCGIIFCFGIFLLFAEINKRKVLLVIIKTALLSLGLSFFFWVPFITQMLSTKIIAVGPTNSIAWLQNFSQAVELALNNGTPQNNNIYVVGIGIIGILSMLLLLITWQKLPLTVKILGILNGLIFLCTTALFPWQLLPHLIITTIQFPYRFYGIISFLSSFVFVYEVKNIFSLRIEHLVISLLIFISFIGLLAISQIKGNEKTNSQYVTPYPLFKPQKNVEYQMYYRLNKKSFYNLFKYPTLFWGITDYSSKKTFKEDVQKSIVSHHVLQRNQKIKANIINVKINSITYSYSTNKQGYVDVPVLYFGNENVTLNGTNVGTQISSRGTIKLLSHKKGRNIVHITYKRPSYFILGYVVAVLCWSFIGYKGFRYFKHEFNSYSSGSTN